MRTNMWIIVALVTAITVFFSTKKRYKWFHIIAKTYQRDLRALKGYITVIFVLTLEKIQKKTISLTFTSLAKKHPQKVAFFFEEDTWTFAQVEDFTNKIARYFKRQGFKKGDCVALMLENRPEFPAIWLGLSKIGVVTALINTNLVNDPLLHSIKVAQCKAIVFGSNHLETIKEVQGDLQSERLYQFHETTKDAKDILTNCIDLRNELKYVSDEPLDEDLHLDVTHPLLYIYTSGTTGLPKAAIITNMRFLFAAWGLYVMGNFKANDIFYNSLPLYHSGGGMLGIGQTVVAGMTTAIRKKFSASNYWKDCAKYKCTIAQYVGEICRYILAARHEEPVNHCVRAICGNGLRREIWSQFVTKFNIKEVYEFYGATEGISNLLNIDNTVGAVGFVPRYAQWVHPVVLIKCDGATGEPIRDRNGYYTECSVNEAGLAIAQIRRLTAVHNFDGYADKKATEKKILHNVFRDGDAYFNSGDILVRDEYGYFYFKDRTGDTYRWKGENVSTNEVEGVIINLLHLEDAVVYGVKIPETEGRAGMVAVVNHNKTLNLDLLARSFKHHLPSYAIPLFVRVMESLPTTGTYKLKKVELREEGYNINEIKDRIYFYDSKLGKYVDLTKDLYELIMTGNAKL